MTDVQGAIDSLTNHQQQLDMDGVMVGVSREALEVVLTLLSARQGEAASGAEDKRINNLAVFVARLIRRVRMHDVNDVVAAQAYGYLQRECIEFFSPLRDLESPLPVEEGKRS